MAARRQHWPGPGLRAVREDDLHHRAGGAAADAGYRVIVALLGSTNLLLQQNQNRLVQSLGSANARTTGGSSSRTRRGVSGGKEMRNWLDRDRVVLVPVLKHAGRDLQSRRVLAKALRRPVPRRRY